MTARHPIIGVTGSSGAGTSTAVRAFDRMCATLGIRPAIVEGDAFHAYDREGNRRAIARARIRGEHFSLLGPAGNLLMRLETLLREYGHSGTGISRRYLHTEAEAQAVRQSVGTFTPWMPITPDTDLLFYEGLHGGYVGEDANIAEHMDLLVGVVPIVNLEWIQKIRRDNDERGSTPSEITSTILRRMPDYVNHIAPQFSRTDVNFQRVPLVDTSNPFVVREIPGNEESLVVIHFNEHTRLSADLDRYEFQIPGAFRSNAQTLVVPGDQIETAMEAILMPALQSLLARRAQAIDAAASQNPLPPDIAPA
ncbi:MAG: phosphoribulokinase [Hydrocarboniphaga sp.]|uniref:phosphoribulokinase n=1 Tax=Hydrocarboniphaga sp. TaxID=2033016 RepID=UPI00260BDDE9|nr:phosphoribulokinase [Hydrocarboniphaga sp.]MDB5972884.1 phosphoribulokinase [Hydrocarboniphaga sp.]